MTERTLSENAAALLETRTAAERAAADANERLHALLASESTYKVGDAVIARRWFHGDSRARPAEVLEVTPNYRWAAKWEERYTVGFFRKDGTPGAPVTDARVDRLLDEGDTPL